ncbi:phospho-N-acetylmuramoyl-pentapeptide-transferase [Candidatus Dojkabacteria bacterium]|nr:phospho-N-acetylmuramoyl-pentapeptide-transferase [Candidatus Dojkabacteria bacterium]
MRLDDILAFSVLNLLISFLIAFPIITLLYRFGIVRQIDVDFSTLIEKRKLKVGTPIMGGLIIIIAVALTNLAFNWNGSTKIPLLVFLISAALGAFDDVLNIYGKERRVKTLDRIWKLIKVHRNKLTRIKYFLLLPWYAYKRLFFILGSNPGKGIQAHEKVIIQLVAGVLLGWWVYFRTGWDMPGQLDFFQLGTLDIGYLIIPFAALVVVAMANAVNLSDGMDGLAAGLLFPAFGALFVIAFHQEVMLKLVSREGIDMIPMTLLSVSVMASLISYLYFNIPPARFQMGDVGSLALGTLFAAIAFALQVPMLLPIIGFPFVAEIGASLIQGLARRVIGRRVFKMAPLHHHFELLGWSEEKVTMRFWLAGIVCAMFGLFVYFV